MEGFLNWKIEWATKDGDLVDVNEEREVGARNVIRQLLIRNDVTRISLYQFDWDKRNWKLHETIKGS